jgi:hypothetical protein
MWFSGLKKLASLYVNSNPWIVLDNQIMFLAKTNWFLALEIK